MSGGDGMSDATTTLDPDAVTPVGSDASPLTAGQMLKAAREGAGMHIGALSVALKVPVRKLELLEADAHDQLPGATFTRALAQSVCRALKMDAAPVLALLPGRQDAGLDHAVIGGARRDAFASSPVQAQSQRAGALLPRPVLLVAAALLLAAAALLLLPPLSTWFPEALLGVSTGSPQGVSPSKDSAGPNVMATGQVPQESSKATALEAGMPPASTDVAGAKAATSAEPSALASAGAGGGAVPTKPLARSALAVTDGNANAPLQLRTTAPSWVEVRDTAGTVVYTGTVVPGVPVGVELKASGQLVVGNAASTDVIWRGRQLDLVSAARDNVARVELK